MAIGNISSNTYLSENDIKCGKFYGNIYDFSVDYEQINNENILNIHVYLMIKKQHCINEQ